MAASAIVLVVMAVLPGAKACAEPAAAASEAHHDIRPGPLSRYDPAHRNIVDPPEPGAARQPPSPGRAQSIDESAPDPFGKRFPPPRAGAPREQLLVDQANRSLSRSVFEMPGLMSDTQRADPRRTGRLEWTSPLPSAPDDLGRRLRERAAGPATR